MNYLYKSYQAALFCLTSILLTNGLFAQRTLTAHASTKIDAFIGGFYTSLPASYGSSGSKAYPLLIFVHGLGELGDGSAAALPAVLRNGPIMQINQEVNNKKDANFPDPVVVNGKSYEFIVVAPQFNQWPSFANTGTAINDLIAYCQKNYRVDASKIYMTGLSMGGGITWDYAGSSFNNKLAGVVVVAGAQNSSAGPVSMIVKNHLPVWATANQVDNTVPTAATNLWVSSINAAGANPAALVNIFPASGHGGWLQTYGAVNQAGVVNSKGQNVYQWMLQYKRSGSNVVIDNATPAQAPPSVNAGPAQTITLPAIAAAATTAAASTASTTLSGSASSAGSISSYVWTQVSGPNTASFGNAKAVSTAVGNLVAGTYVFKLTVTDNMGQSSSAQTTVVVNAAPAPVTEFTISAGPDITVNLPVKKVEIKGSTVVRNETVGSCTWTQVSGPNTAKIEGNGSISPSVSNLAVGTYQFKVSMTSKSGKIAEDAMNLNVNPDPLTKFTVSAGPDASIKLPTNAFLIKGTATVKGEGVSSCKWSQISGPSTAKITNGGSINPTVSNLIGGVYVFEVRIVSTSGVVATDRMSLNVALASANSVSSTSSISEVSMFSDSAASQPNLKLYPNPVQAGQQMTLEGQGLKSSTVKISVYDLSGRLAKQMILQNQADYVRQAIQTTDLTRGMYVMTVSTDTGKAQQFKFVVQ